MTTILPTRETVTAICRFYSQHNWVDLYYTHSLYQRTAGPVTCISIRRATQFRNHMHRILHISGDDIYRENIFQQPMVSISLSCTTSTPHHNSPAITSSSHAHQILMKSHLQYFWWGGIAHLRETCLNCNWSQLITHNDDPLYLTFVYLVCNGSIQTQPFLPLFRTQPVIENKLHVHFVNTINVLLNISLCVFYTQCIRKHKAIRVL